MKHRKSLAVFTAVLLSTSLTFAQTNVTTITGGTANYIPKFTGASNIENSSLFDNGNVGIGTTSPSAKFQVNNGALLFTGTTGSTPVSGAGTRMMWIPDKAAFRSGTVTSTQWDDANIGPYSFAAGYNTTAGGTYSTAFGRDNLASGNSSTVFGAYNFAIGNYSMASGIFSNASGDLSIAFGVDNTASGYTSIAFGSYATASGDFSTAFGYYTVASSYSSTAFGRYTTASGYYSTAFGQYTTAQAYGSFVIGRYNVIEGTTDSWENTEPLFVIGNGSSSGSRSNAMTVLKNGKVGIGTTDPQSELAVNGKITAKEVEVTLTGWPDFVFEENYSLKPIAELENYIKTNKHLPDVPSETEVKENGVNLGEMDAILLQKIEELTLYVIEQDKNFQRLEKENEAIKLQNKELIKRVSSLENTK